MISDGDQYIFILGLKGLIPGLVIQDLVPLENGGIIDGSAFFGPDISGNLSAYQNHEVQFQLIHFMTEI